MISRRLFLVTPLIIVLSLTAMVTKAQSFYSYKTQDSLVQALVKRHITLNTARQTMPGYRIQVFFGPQRSEATDLKNDLNKMYPDLGAYIIYQQPNFKIRVGDFKTRLEAQKFLTQLKSIYNTAFIVNDEVKLPILP